MVEPRVSHSTNTLPPNYVPSHTLSVLTQLYDHKNNQLKSLCNFWIKVRPHCPTSHMKSRDECDCSDWNSLIKSQMLHQEHKEGHKNTTETLGKSLGVCVCLSAFMCLCTCMYLCPRVSLSTLVEVNNLNCSFYYVGPRD